jgi:hypothetical protein
VRDEHILVTDFSGSIAYMMVFLIQILHFFTDEAWIQLNGYTNAQNNMYRSNINPRRTLEAPFVIRR